ncbi:MAG TPA: hypothetical protein ENJ95_15115 [Bacteroidetes bacterium]|nr:hypothetical protein [Bacteroidota bacterium]
MTIPANWEQGEKVVIDPAISEHELREEFPQGYEEVKPYLRYTVLPG